MSLPNIQNVMIFAMARSGHHAVMNWVFNQIVDRKIMHYNNCNRALDWELKILKPRAGKIHSYNNEKSDCLNVFHIENFDLNNFQKYRMNQFPQLNEETLYIIINRDPYNWIASSIAKSGEFRDDILERIELWKKLMYQSTGEDDFLTSAHFLDINYNEWFTSKKYRKYLADRLDVPFTDAGKQAVPSNCGGSSFDKKRFNGKAEKMDVLNRWRNVIHQEFYKELIKDKELARLGELYFKFTI